MGKVLMLVPHSVVVHQEQFLVQKVLVIF
ncbi:UNVERIFIED_CONTAM: hypothetical protein GTU68_021835 [Idotea baltica]|nr:hypothetical protein [Idotea baltica]